MLELGRSSERFHREALAIREQQTPGSDTVATSYFIFPNTVIYCGALSPDKLFINVMRMFPADVGNLVTHGGSPGVSSKRVCPYSDVAPQSANKP